MLSSKKLTPALIVAVAAGPAFAQESPGALGASAPPSGGFETFSLLICGLLVMFMAAGFAMKQGGLVRAKSAASVSLRSFATYALAGLMMWLVSYNLMFMVRPGGLLGVFEPWSLDGVDAPARGMVAAEWFFRMGCVAMAAMIVSGALAERMRLWPFLIFAAVFTGLIFPIEASWQWGGGYLRAKWAFVDLAGSTVIHSAAGWAALAGAIVLGPRQGKYDGRMVHAMPGSNMPLAALGAFILWLGWFGLSAGSHIIHDGAFDAGTVAKIFINTNMSAAASVITAMLLTQIIFKKVDLTVVLNGAVAGLVSISAEPFAPAIWQAVVIGAMGGVIVSVAVPVLDRLYIDDVVGAIPAHLLCGIWGTFITPWSNSDANYLGQTVAIVMVGAFVFIMSLLVWVALKYTIGVRLSAEQEQIGLDKTELGLDAYPSFSKL